MDLNQLELSPFLLQNLYSSTLVELSGASTPIEPADSGIMAGSPAAAVSSPKKENAWKSLGENRKHILLVVSNPDSTYLPDHSFQFLLGILGACKLSMEDVALVNLAIHPKTNYTQLIKEFKPGNVFLFGIEPLNFGLPMDFPAFQAQPFSNCIFLHAPSLEELNQDKVLKSKLWVSLRRIFGL